MKVFHGISGAAGQPSSIAAALRSRGVEATTYVTGENKFGFERDRQVAIEGNAAQVFFDLLSSELLSYDVFHFYFRPLFFDSKSLRYPVGLDLLLLRSMGKKIVMHFRGSEVRLHSQFRARSPFHYVDENPDDLVTKFPESSQEAYISMARSVCNHVLVPDPELQSYVNGAQVVPRSIDLDVWQAVPPVRRDRPVVVHAPSRRGVKGTESLLRAVDVLKGEGLAFEFRLIEGLTNQEAREAYRDADVIVDQLRIGWYGVLAVEGMALQKAVVSYIRDDLRHHLGTEPPIEIANPNNIEAVLRELIESFERRAQVAARGLQYCQRVHDSHKVAEKLVGIYGSEGSSLDESTLVEFFGAQHALSVGEAKARVAELAELTRENAILSRKLARTEEHLQSIRRKLAPFIWLRDRLVGPPADRS